MRNHFALLGHQAAGICFMLYYVHHTQVTELCTWTHTDYILERLSTCNSPPRVCPRLAQQSWHGHPLFDTCSMKDWWFTMIQRGHCSHVQAVATGRRAKGPAAVVTRSTIPCPTTFPFRDQCPVFQVTTRLR